MLKIQCSFCYSCGFSKDWNSSKRKVGGKYRKWVFPSAENKEKRERRGSKEKLSDTTNIIIFAAERAECKQGDQWAGSLPQQKCQELMVAETRPEALQMTRKTRPHLKLYFLRGVEPGAKDEKVMRIHVWGEEVDNTHGRKRDGGLIRWSWGGTAELSKDRRQSWWWDHSELCGFPIDSQDPERIV